MYALAFLIVLLTAVQPFAKSAAEFDASHYADLYQEFEARAAIVQENESQLLARYFPTGAAETDTNPEPEAFPGESLSRPAAVAPVENLPSVSGEKININKATVDELVKLPGIGPAIAARIVEYRAEFGPFKSVDELLNVRGIGKARLEAIRDLVTVEEST